jgi:hypothetical protein
MSATVVRLFERNYHDPMSFTPDIVVTTEDSSRILMIVETKLTLTDLERLESALKKYMIGMGSPVGLIVSPEQLALYRDRYTGRSEESVKRIGIYPMPKMWTRFRPVDSGSSESLQNRGLRFEDAVQSWLEALPAAGVAKDFSAETRDALMEYVLPAVSEGTVRAAGPRELRA